MHRRIEPLFDGSVESMSDLLSRAVTVIDRGGDGYIVDFKWLLAEVATKGQFPAGDSEVAGESCLLSSSNAKSVPTFHASARGAHTRRNTKHQLP